MRWGDGPRCCDGRRQRQFPILSHQISAEAVVRLFTNQGKPGSLVNATGGDQDIIRPQCEPAIAGSAREADAFGDEPAAYAQPASFWLDIEQAQLGNFRGVLDEQHRADDLSVTLGDPAALPPVIKIF